jgi:hypothetical protein
MPACTSRTPTASTCRSPISGERGSAGGQAFRPPSGGGRSPDLFTCARGVVDFHPEPEGLLRPGPRQDFSVRYEALNANRRRGRRGRQVAPIFGLTSGGSRSGPVLMMIEQQHLRTTLTESQVNVVYRCITFPDMLYIQDIRTHQRGTRRPGRGTYERLRPGRLGCLGLMPWTGFGGEGGCPERDVLGIAQAVLW